MQSQYIHMIANLILILGLMLLTVYLMKKFKLTKFTNNKYIKIINAVSLGAKEKVILMEVNDTFFLIGSTPNHIETLYVFDELKTKEEKTSEKVSPFAKQVAEMTD